MKFLQWLKMVLRRFRAQGVHYIGGSDVLPPPLSPEEEAAAVEANSGGDVAGAQPSYRAQSAAGGVPGAQV